LGMCVHGTIGLVVTLAYLGKIKPGQHRIETPVGIVSATLHDGAEVTVENVPSYRTAQNVRVDVPGYGPVSGDVAWGGNWFFMAKENPLELSLSNVDALTEYAWAIRRALEKNGITGKNGEVVDHIELYGPSRIPKVDSKNFVLCPGKAYDRSPCGTGTSAKLACLYADGKLKAGEVWRLEGIVGTIFEGRVRVDNGFVVPTINGSAYITADSNILLDPRDPFRFGISG
jgi:4-hydroxyproline epimerase